MAGEGGVVCGTCGCTPVQKGMYRMDQGSMYRNELISFVALQEVFQAHLFLP